MFNIEIQRFELTRGQVRARVALMDRLAHGTQAEIDQARTDLAAAEAALNRFNEEHPTPPQQ